MLWPGHCLSAERLTPSGMELLVHCRTHITVVNLDSGNQSPARQSAMSDNKKRVGKADRDRVAAGEPYEVNRLAKKVGLPPKLVQNVIRQEGPTRTNVEAYLKRMKRNGQ